MTGLAIPARLDWLRASEAGRAWLAAVPARVAGCAERWSLRLGEPVPDSYVSAGPVGRYPGWRSKIAVNCWVLPHGVTWSSPLVASSS